MSKSKTPYFLTELRATSTIEYSCHADPILFLDWEKMPKKARNEFTKNGPIPCQGGGAVGEWCGECRFGRVESEE